MRGNLSIGCTNDEVLALQRSLGYRMPPGSARLKPDRIFGPKTEAAVKAYQVLHHLVPDGIVGPRTRDAVNTRLFVVGGTLYRQMPSVKAASLLAARSALELRTSPAQSTPPLPPPSQGSTVLQLQPGLTMVARPWIFPPGQQPGTILQKSLQLSIVYKQGDGIGHVEAGAFVQVSSNSQSGPGDPMVSFTGGWQCVAADLLAPWLIPKLRWQFHPVSLVFQQTLVFNARPASVALGFGIGEQAQLDLGSDRFGVVIGGIIVANGDLTNTAFSLGVQATLGGVVQF